MTTTPPPSLESLRSDIDMRLREVVPVMAARLGRLHADLALPAATLGDFLEGGKRIRPALLQIGFWCVDGDDPAAVIDPALALELLHTCALVHDDIIDGAATRRSRPTVHHAFTDRHRREQWLGEPERYGQAVAILVGDLAFVHADELFLRCALPADRLMAGFRVFTEMREEVMAGQFLDLHSAVIGSRDRAHALAVATLKSGRYSVTRPLEIGAVLADAPAELIAVLRAFGDPLGRAFQVRDDILGVFGSGDQTGKSTASDLAEGKRTLLVAEAFARADTQQARVLADGLGDADIDEAGADRLREVIAATGARQAAEDYIERSVDEALLALDDLPTGAPGGDVLREVAHQLGFRAS